MTRELLVLDNVAVRSLLQDVRVTELVPCLQGPRKKLTSLQPGKPNCNLCARMKKRKAGMAIRKAKQCLKNLSGEQLRKLKEILGTRQIRLALKDGKGRRVEYTL